MKATGHRGEVKIAGRTAARLGKWSFVRDRGKSRVRVQARVDESDSFLLSRKPLELDLDALSSPRSVESIELENGNASIMIVW